MLEPQQRMSIYDLLRPPAGFELDCLVVTTYSAALDTVLSLPAAMLVDGTGAATQGPRTITAVDLAALKRICARTAIFCQGAAILPTERISAAIIEAEEMVHEVTAPNKGSFHPKVWVMRFRRSDKSGSVLRVAIMSRNLTGDTSWDAGIVLEGTTKVASEPNDLGALLRLLPTRCLRPLDPERRRLLQALADEVETTKWRMPAGVGTPTFHLIGDRPGQSWAQPRCDRLAVISPFLTTGALKELSRAATTLPLLVSRPIALEQCWPGITGRFDRSMVLAPPEVVGEAPRPTSLHAKILLWENRARLRAAIGSMNATSAAISGRNVEFMVSFDCTRAMGAGGIDALLERRSLGAVLDDFEPEPGAAPVKEPPDDRPARAYLLAAQLHLACSLGEFGWEVRLVPKGPHPDLEALLPNLRFRPATLSTARAGACGPALVVGETARLPGLLELAEITGFVVFEADGPEGSIAFVLNLEVRGVEDEERRHAALKSLLPDARSFSDLLRILLGDFHAMEVAGGVNDILGPMGASRATGQAGLLETLIRCAADEPDRLQSIKQTLEAFKPEELETVAPPEFLKLWSALLETVSAGS